MRATDELSVADLAVVPTCSPVPTPSSSTPTSTPPSSAGCSPRPRTPACARSSSRSAWPRRPRPRRCSTARSACTRSPRTSTRPGRARRPPRGRHGRGRPGRGRPPARPRCRARLGASRNPRQPPVGRRPRRMPGRAPCSSPPPRSRSPTSPAPVDSMTAGYVNALLDGADVVEAARYGQVLAALTLRLGGHRSRRPHRRARRGPPDPHPAPHRGASPMTTTRTAPHPMLKVAPEVAEALAAGAPVVALESTIISHGLPYPQNVAMATGRSSRSSATPARCRRRSPSSTAAPRGPRPDQLDLLAPTRTSARSASATSRTSSRPGCTGPRRWRARCASPRSPASGCSSRAASAGCTRAPRARWTSPPTSPSCRAPRSSSSAPA